MHGCYENFPENIHGKAIIQNMNNSRSLQESIFYTFERLNNEIFDLSTITPYVKNKCAVSFEVGVADGNIFNFLDQNELEQYLKNTKETKYETLDFFFVVRYHITKLSGKRVPLRFDYLILRFFFKKGCMKFSIRHEKGTLRIPLDDLTIFLLKQINVELSRKNLVPLFNGEYNKININNLI